MSIALLMITDGRDDYLARCVASANANLRGAIAERWMFDDTGDDKYRAVLADRFPQFRHINGGPRRGFGGAIRSAWAYLARHSDADFVFHLEADFVFRHLVDLNAMVAVLTERPHLAQMALRRQPWNADETAAGGVVDRNPRAYVERCDEAGRMWLEHRLFLTTNPSLYRRSLLNTGWPDCPQSEGVFTHRLLTHGLPGVHADRVAFGYWGARDSGVWVEHIGHQRVGVGY